MECTFCSAVYQHKGPAYYAHISGHLREVSLAALPQTIEDTDDDSESSHATSSISYLGEVPKSDDQYLPLPIRGSHESPWVDGDMGSEEESPVARSPPLKTAHNGMFGDNAPNIEIDLDSIIDRLLEVRGSPPGRQVQLLEMEIEYLCEQAREIFMSQPILLELDSPLKV